MQKDFSNCIRKRIFERYLEKYPQLGPYRDKTSKNMLIVRVIATARIELNVRGWNKDATWQDVREGQPSSVNFLLYHVALNRVPTEDKEYFNAVLSQIFSTFLRGANQACRYDARAFSHNENTQEWELRRKTDSIVFSALDYAYEHAMTQLMDTPADVRAIHKNITTASLREPVTALEL